MFKFAVMYIYIYIIPFVRKKNMIVLGCFKSFVHFYEFTLNCNISVNRVLNQFNRNMRHLNQCTFANVRQVD